MSLARRSHFVRYAAAAAAAASVLFHRRLAAAPAADITIPDADESYDRRRRRFLTLNRRVICSRLFSMTRRSLSLRQIVTTRAHLMALLE